MKKNSIIAVIIIYIAAILIVGFLGIDLKVYEPVTYVESIKWNNSEYLNKSEYKIIVYDENDPEKAEVDAKLTYVTDSLGKGVVFNIKCYSIPNNATNSTLSYYMNVKDETIFNYEIQGDNTCNITFFKGCGARLIVSSTDNSNVKYKIDFEIIDLSDIF